MVHLLMVSVIGGLLHSLETSPYNDLLESNRAYFSEIVGFAMRIAAFSLFLSVE